jgi:tetratricopeptide (TPR) repeat protein
VTDFKVARLDEIEEVTDGRCPWRPVRRHLGITAFGVNAWTGKEAGDRIINEHDEGDDGDRQEELYLVESGRARFELDGEHVEAPAGTFVFVQPGVKRTAFAEEPGTTLISVGAVPGQAYEPSGWESWAPYQALYEAGDYAAVVERGRAAIEAEQEPGPLYNLACCEALAGRPADAIEHLRRAIELSERFRAFAQGDSDFDGIRDEPAFAELVGAKG